MKRAFERPFDPVTRVSGVINLGTAENKLLVREFAAKLKTEFAAGVTPKDLLYGDFNGEPELRSSLASMLSRHMGNFPIDPAHIVVQNGCGTVVESLAMVLCDPGDAFLILTPYYGGFDIDFVKRAGVQLLPVDLHSSNGYAVSIPDLERVLADARRRGINVRGFVISSPNNPLGSSYTRGELQSMVDFCHRHDLHFISDEIYLLSDFSSVIGKPESAVVPVLSLQIPDPSRVHIVWGFSKDFGASGLRVGLSYTRNPAVLSALQGVRCAISLFGSTSTNTIAAVVLYRRIAPAARGPAAHDGRRPVGRQLHCAQPPRPRRIERLPHFGPGSHRPKGAPVHGGHVCVGRLSRVPAPLWQAGLARGRAGALGPPHRQRAIHRYAFLARAIEGL